MTAKVRIDQLLVERGLARSREEAKRLIMSGAVLVDGEPADKPGREVPQEAEPVVTAKREFVSRGGEKLHGALHHFNLPVDGATALDVGASTGGFTDCLLQHGAVKVYALDVGYGQLDASLRNHPKVVVMERVNARNLKPEDFPETMDLAVIDVAFISLKLILPAVKPLVRSGGLIAALIKPQFEAGRRDCHGGVVRDPVVHERVIREISDFARELGLTQRGEVIPSPLLGPKGNREFFICLAT